jgi:hypothetical protein
VAEETKPTPPEDDAPKEAPPAAEGTKTRPRRRWLVNSLVILASLLAFISIFALWANRQFLNTDNWTKTSSQLLQKSAVREQVAGFIVDQIYANVNVEQQLASALPPQAKPLAGPAAGALRNAADQGVQKLLERPKVQQLWENANRFAHQQLLKVIEGGGKNVSTTGGNVTLNLGQMIGSLASNLGLTQVASQIPANAGQITVLHSNKLEAVQNGLKALRGITIVVLVLTFLLYGFAVFIAGRRREALRAVGWGLIIAGVLALIARSVAGGAIVDSLASTAAVKPAIQDVWDIGSSLLNEAAQSAIAYGVVIVLGAWLAGGTGWATSARRAMAPFLSDARWAFGGVGFVYLLILIWGPTPATRKPLAMLIFAILIAIGVEALRRQAARENPGASMADVGRFGQRRLEGAKGTLSAGTHAVSGAVGRITGGRGGHDDAPTPPATPTSPDAARLEQLERLGQLHDTGVLDDAEFKAEKAKVLTSSPT